MEESQIQANNGKAEVIQNEMAMTGNMGMEPPNGLKIDTQNLANLTKLPKFSDLMNGVYDQLCIIVCFFQQCMGCCFFRKIKELEKKLKEQESLWENKSQEEKSLLEKKVKEQESLLLEERGKARQMIFQLQSRVHDSGAHILRIQQKSEDLESKIEQFQKENDSLAKHNESLRAELENKIKMQSTTQTFYEMRRKEDMQNLSNLQKQVEVTLI